jgi:sugar phosphate isomerase/epimerase
MTALTRREWARLALGGLAVAALPFEGLAQARKINSKINGVQLGAQSYSFRDRPLDAMLAAMAEVGLGSCELWSGHLEPGELRGKGREALRQWRLTTPLEEFKAVRAKFDRAGIDLYAFNLSFRDDFTDEEIKRGFEMARALGAKVMTSSSNVSTVKRIDPFAKQFKMRVGMHNHDNTKDPNEFATVESFAKAMEGTSKYIAINLDIGHFTAANNDPVAYLRQHHDRIVTLHIKDRKRDHGPAVPFGQGDTPIKEVLALLKENRWDIPANIEYEYKGGDTVEEVRKCFEYCKAALGA